MYSNWIRPPRKKVAIVGTGVTGIGALWALNGTPCDVYLYDSEDRLGGHTNTATYHHKKFSAKVDTGFIVLNDATYPNFIAFLKALNVPTELTDMTFGVSRDGGRFEWAGKNLFTVFAQKKNLFSPRMWRMLFDIIRFNQYALDLLINSVDAETTEGHGDASVCLCPKNYRQQPRHRHLYSHNETIGDYLEREGYSDAFRDDYLIPMTAAVWSTSPDKCTLEFPALTLVRFLWNHHLLTTVGLRPQWRTLKLCSQSYIDAALDVCPPAEIKLKHTVQGSHTRKDGKVTLQFKDREDETFDHVILCTHAPTSLSILGDEATDAERSILSAFKTSENTAVLHSDKTLLPTRQNAWSAWNYMTISKPHPSCIVPRPNSTIPKSANIDSVCLTYNMNILQHLPREIYGDVLVTLNPLHPPNPSTVQGTYKYQHPLYTVAAMTSQKLLPAIQNTRGISYAGAWTKYGFHEDGLTSGIEAAMHIGGKVTWEFKDSKYSRGKAPELGFKDWIVRAFIWCIMVLLNPFSEAAGSVKHVEKKRGRANAGGNRGKGGSYEKDPSVIWEDEGQKGARCKNCKCLKKDCHY